MTDSTESTPIEDAATEETPKSASTTDAGFIESVFLLGLGAASATRTAVESLSKDLVERGKMSQQEATKFAQDLARRADESTKKLQDTASEGSNKAASFAGFATKADVARIEGEIAEIKQLLVKGSPVGDAEPYIP
jgi:polyhydroxyalkanoate synthesis regulator phasin